MSTMKSTSNETKSTSSLLEKSSISTTSHSLKEQKIRENEIIDNKLNIVFHEAATGIAPGQSAVIYEGDDLIGGGFIDRKPLFNLK